MLREIGAFLFAHKEPLLCETLRLPQQEKGERKAAAFWWPMKVIQLTRGYAALVDDEDYERVIPFKWHAQVSKRHALVYATRVTSMGTKDRTVLLHRFILNAPDGMVVDHIDGNGLNCTRANMRLCSHAENMRNRRVGKTTASGYKGVFWVKRGKKHWHAMIRQNGRIMSLGYFLEAKDAARAYDAKARELFGEFAKTNF